MIARCVVVRCNSKEQTLTFFEGSWYCNSHYYDAINQDNIVHEPLSLKEYARNTLQKALLSGPEIDIFGLTLKKVKQEELLIDNEKRKFLKTLDKKTKDALRTESVKKRDTPLINFLEHHLKMRTSSNDDIYVQRVREALEKYTIAQDAFEIETSAFLGARVLRIVWLLRKALNEKLGNTQKDRNLKKLELFFTVVPNDVVEILCSIDDPDFVIMLCNVFDFTQRKNVKIIKGEITLRQHYDSIVNIREKRKLKLQEIERNIELERRAREISWKLFKLSSCF